MVCPSKPPCRFDPKVANPAQAESRRFINLENALGRALTSRPSPCGSRRASAPPPVNLTLANSNAAMVALAGPSHNSAAKGATNKWHTSGLVGPLDHNSDRGEKPHRPAFGRHRRQRRRLRIHRAVRQGRQRGSEQLCAIVGPLGTVRPAQRKLQQIWLARKVCWILRTCYALISAGSE